MKFLKQPSEWLPVRLRSYTDHATGITVTGGTAEALYKHLVRELLAAGHPVDGEALYKDIINHICADNPEACTDQEEGDRKFRVENKNFTVNDVKAFLSSVSEDVKNSIVSKEVAAKRSQVCFSCPYNRHIGGCMGCNGVTNLVYSLLGKKRVYRQEHLQNCGVCGCSLSAKIWASPEALKKSANIQKNAADYPSWCWMKDVINPT